VTNDRIDQQAGNKATQIGIVKGSVTIINYPRQPSPVDTKSDTPFANEPVPENPYRGLFAFRPEHAHLFFGRETFTNKLSQATKSRSLVAVLGASGSGKSSVVFAGLVPALDATGQWLFTTLRPGDDPFLALANALVPLYETDLSKTKRLVAARELSASLKAGKLLLSDVLNFIRQSQPNHRFLIIADQFEELYTLCRDSDTRQHFLDVLLQIADKPPSSSTRLVLTLRADFLGQASLYRPFADALQGATELIGPMTGKELTEAVAQPAALQGVQFEDKLVDRILDDVGEEEGSLPLLEFGLTELWQHQSQRTLTHVAYEEIGRAKGALSVHANQVYQHLSPNEQKQARRIFVQLVNPGVGTEDTRRLATRTELEQDWLLVAKLASERLLVTNQVENELDTVEVVHEALISNWTQLRTWIDQDREFRTWQQGFRAELQQWQEMNQDEGALLRGAPLAVATKKLAERPADLNEAERDFINASLQQQRQQEQRRRLFFIGAIVATVIMAILAFCTSAERDRAEDQLRLSTSRELAAAAINNLSVDPERSILLATHALTVAYTIEAEDALHKAIQASRVRLTIRGHDDQISRIAFSPDGKRLATASRDGTAKLWDSQSGQIQLTLTSNTDRISDVIFSPDGEHVATASWDRTAKIWDATSGQELLTLSGHTNALNSIAYSPDGTRLVTTSQDRTARVWDSVSGQQLLIFNEHTSWVLDAKFGWGGKRVVTGSWDGTAKVWNAASGEVLANLLGHSGPVKSIALSLDEKKLATASTDLSAKVWNISFSEELLTLSGHTDQISRVEFSPDGARVVTASWDGSAKVWDADSGRLLLTLTGHIDKVRGVALSPDGTRLATASDDRVVKVWDFKSGQELVTLSGHGVPVIRVTYSPDGTRLATSSSDGSVRIWDSASGQMLLNLSGHTDLAIGVAFSPDGKLLATTSADGTAKVWDASNGQELLTLSGHKEIVTDVAFSTDGMRLATSSQDSMAKLWDGASGQILLTLSGHNGPVNGVTFDPDGIFVATASHDRTVKMWDSHSGEEVLTLSGHKGPVMDVSYSPDGTRLATSSQDGTVRIHLMKLEELLALARSRTTRTWTPIECKQFLHQEQCPLAP
jgi:WD40 repeat protein